MSSKNRSLLEAFKASGAEASLPAAAPARARGGSGSGTTLSSARLQMLVLAQLILLVVAFLLGRASVRKAEASEVDESTASADLGSGGDFDAAAQPPSGGPQAPPAPSSSDPAPSDPAQDGRSGATTQVDPRPQTDAERALLDPANLYTVKLVEYANTTANLQLAQDTLRYVTGVQSMPACLASAGTRLYVLIGAAPAKAELESLLERARKMNGPPPLSKRGEFHDAYLEKIDKVFKRK